MQSCTTVLEAPKKGRLNFSSTLLSPSLWSLAGGEEVSMFIVPAAPPCLSHLPGAIMNEWRNWPRIAVVLPCSTPPVELRYFSGSSFRTRFSWYRRIKTVFERHRMQAEHLGVLSVQLWATFLRYPGFSCAKANPLRPRQGHSVTPAERYSISSHRKDLLSQACAFQSATNKQFNWVRPPQSCLNNNWKQRHIAKSCQTTAQLGLFSGKEWVWLPNVGFLGIPDWSVKESRHRSTFHLHTDIMAGR